MTSNGILLFIHDQKTFLEKSMITSNGILVFIHDQKRSLEKVQEVTFSGLLLLLLINDQRCSYKKVKYG